MSWYMQGGQVVVAPGGGIFDDGGTPPPPTAFDFIISPNGDDNNPGTLASPWSLTALNNNQAAYSGKKVGLTPGTYQKGFKGGVPSTSIYAFLQTGVNGSFAYINGSTNPASPTYIASCDASGNYSPRTAVIDGSNPSGGGLPSADQTYMIGNQYYGASTPPPNGSNIVVDGLIIQNGTFAAIGFGDVQVTPVLTGIVIQNCQIGPCTCSVSNNNPGGIFLGRTTGAQLLNNYILNCITNGGPFHPWGMGGVTTYTALGLIMTNNTITGCGYSVQNKDTHKWLSLIHI